MHIKEAVQFGRKFLAGKKSAHIEAEILLMHLLGFNREKLFIAKDFQLNKRDEAKFKQFLSLLKNDYPIAYITGEKEFYGEKFFVNENVLIPRPETELLVENIIFLIDKIYSETKRTVNIADIGTGSGCIGISAALKCPHAFIVASDISADVISVARKNCRKFKLENRMKFVKSHLLNKLIDQKFDIIAANLPYIGTEKYNFIDYNVKQYEPHTALYGGRDGLDLYRNFFRQILEMRYKPKFVLGEFGFGQGNEMRKLMNKYFVQKLGATYEIKKDYAGIERVFIINLWT